MKETARASVFAQLAPGPLFIVSMWRGGSSLLYALLNKHPQVALTFEADLWLLRSVFAKPDRYCDWAERLEFWNGALSRHGMTAEDLPREPADYVNAFTTLHQTYAIRQGAVIWGDKSPNYYDSLEALARRFPAARFIVQWRDPLGIANAIARGAQSGGLYFKRRGTQLKALLGNQVLKREVDYLASKGIPLCQIRYEDLTRDPAGVMREVCDFLSIPYRHELSELRGADRSAIFAEAHHAMVRGSDIVSSARSWILDRPTERLVGSYVKFWRQRYRGAWPDSVTGLDGGSQGIVRRTSDWAAYRTLRAYDEFRQTVFCYAPMGWLRRWREESITKRLRWWGTHLDSERVANSEDGCP